MGKNKLQRFEEIRKFKNVFEPDIVEALHQDFYMKSRWNELYFKNQHPIILELGCGKGEYTLGLAKKYPEKNFIGVDIKGARIWRGAKTAIDEKIYNAAFLRTRIEMIGSFFGKDEVDEIWITFPDPQEKKRRKKKRLTAAGFLNSYRNFLKDQGIIHLKTDNDLLYHYSCAVVKYNELELVLATDNLYKDGVEDELLEIKTHYEQLFLKENKNINYLKFKLQSGKNILEPPDAD